MKRFQTIGSALAGTAAGVVNGLFGTGGGMVLIPLLHTFTPLSQDDLFPNSVAVILPICIVTLSISGARNGLPWAQASIWMIGSAVGGILSGFWGKKIPVKWLHRVLGILILYGGVRSLWPIPSP